MVYYKMAKRGAKKSVRRMKRSMSKVKSRVSKAVRRSKKKSTKRKGKKPASNWNKHMMLVYKSMKAKDPSVKLGDAMKAAKKTYKKGLSRPLSMSVQGGGASYGCSGKRSRH